MMQRRGKKSNAKVWTSITNCPDIERGRWAGKGAKHELPLGYWCESMQIHSTKKKACTSWATIYRWLASLCCDLIAVCQVIKWSKAAFLDPDSAVISLLGSNPWQGQEEAREGDLRLEHCYGYCLCIHSWEVGLRQLCRNCLHRELNFHLSASLQFCFISGSHFNHILYIITQWVLF